MRMHMRRFTRLTNGFSKKVENHAHRVALYTVFYHWLKVHKTLRALRRHYLAASSAALVSVYNTAHEH